MPWHNRIFGKRQLPGNQRVICPAHPRPRHANPHLIRRNVFDQNPGGAYEGCTAVPDNLTSTDPEFISPTNTRLQPTSKAVGAADLAFTPPFDRASQCRPISAPDIGAYEQ